MDSSFSEVKTKEVKPKFTPIRCVGCNGFGTISYKRIICHACKGKGFILIPAEEVEK